MSLPVFLGKTGKEDEMGGIIYSQKLLSILNLVPIPMGDNEVSDISLQKAVTANVNLLSIGYSLMPRDIINLAQSPLLDDFGRYFKILSCKNISNSSESSFHYPTCYAEYVSSTC